jgi:hypothetical protein
MSYLIHCSFSRPRRPYKRPALQLGEAPSRIFLQRPAPRPGALVFGALRPGRPGSPANPDGRGVGTRTEAEGRRPGPAGGSRETPAAAAAADSSAQRMP